MDEDASFGCAYDEAIPVETDDEELSTPASSEGEAETPQGNKAQAGQRGGLSPGSGGARAVGHHGAPRAGPGAGRVPHEEEKSGSDSGSSVSESSSETSDGEDEGGDSHSGDGRNEGYNPNDYKNLQVGPDVEEVFQLITRYKPHTIDLDTPFKPFIPELVPGIGEVDAMLKMPRPDGVVSDLGTRQLDEPTLNPSDPSILDLKLRALSKKQDLEPTEVRSIEMAHKNPREIDNWVKRISELSRTKPAPTLNYTRRMPDIEMLMQAWPKEFEEHLQQNLLPEFADLNLDLEQLVRIFASILDVPVHSQMTETLHVIFTLYYEFKVNQHFAGAGGGGRLGHSDDQYNFPHMQPFASGLTLGGPASELVAPSRAPSPNR